MKKYKVVTRYILSYYSFNTLWIRNVSPSDVEHLYNSFDSIVASNYIVINQNNEKHRSRINISREDFNIIIRSQDFIKDYTMNGQYNILMDYLKYDNVEDINGEILSIEPNFKDNDFENPVSFDLQLSISFYLTIEFKSSKDKNKFKLNDLNFYKKLANESILVNVINEKDLTHDCVNDGRDLTMVYSCFVHY